MARLTRFLIALPLVLLVLVASACGGTWDDDPGNFRRAFGGDPPPGTKVLRSHYFRSAHWTVEFEYYFHIEKNPTLEQQLRTTWPLREIKDSDRIGADNTRPSWFAPKPMTAYEVWTYADQPRSSYRLLIDKETGDLFLHDSQI